jgi:integrase
MRERIAIRTVASLRPGETLKDSELIGFEIRARETAKTYSVLYRAGKGRGAPQKRYTIGKHGSPWTPEMARAEAKRVLILVAQGHDPAAVRSEAKAAPTIAALVERFLAEHVAPKRKGSTAREYQRLFDTVVLPVIGKRRVADVGRAEIAQLHHDRRQTPVNANQALARLRTLFDFAERVGLRPEGSNPCRRIEKYPQRHRERFLSAEELGRLGEALACYDAVSPFAVAAIKLLIFTGARRSEILDLRWSWVDFERSEARLPDSKTGAKTVHLPPPALDVLSKLPRIDGNPHVIVGGKAGTRLANLQKPWSAIRERAGLEDVHIHDLRHAFASVAAAGGLGLPIIGALLGHRQAQTTQRYAHLAADPLKAAAAAVAGKIAAAMRRGTNEVVKPAKVTKLAERR